MDGFCYSFDLLEQTSGVGNCRQDVTVCFRVYCCYEGQMGPRRPRGGCASRTVKVYGHCHGLTSAWSLNGQRHLWIYARFHGFDTNGGAVIAAQRHSRWRARAPTRGQRGFDDDGTAVFVPSTSSSSDSDDTTVEATIRKRRPLKRLIRKHTTSLLGRDVHGRFLPFFYYFTFYFLRFYFLLVTFYPFTF